MATSNLISKSFGDILLESGNGTPNHISPRGSYYTNKDSGTLFINADGSTGWDSFNRISYGDIYIQGNSTAVPTGTLSTNTWYLLSGLTFVEGFVNGVTKGNGGFLTVGAGRGGRYQFIATGTLSYLTSTSNYELGVSKNSNVPLTGNYQGATLASTSPTTNIGVQGYIDLVPGDTLQLVARNISTTAKISLSHGVLIVTRVGD